VPDFGPEQEKGVARIGNTDKAFGAFSAKIRRVP
jgi:hypothetical protein